VEQAIVGAPEFVKLRMSKLRLVSGRAVELPIANHASVPLRASIAQYAFTVSVRFSALSGCRAVKKVLCGILDQDLCRIMCPIAAFRKGFPPSV